MPSALADTGSSDGLLSGLLPGGGGLLGGLGSGGLLGGLIPGSSDDSSRYLVEHLLGTHLWFARSHVVAKMLQAN